MFCQQNAHSSLLQYGIMLDGVMNPLFTVQSLLSEVLYKFIPRLRGDGLCL